MTRAFRTFVHVVRADFFDRVRRHGFLVTLGVTLYFAYVFLPPNGAHYDTFQVSGHRGLYGSAWVGAVVSLLASSFLSLIGFFLVKNAIDRDRSTGVGQILASTPLSKLVYVLGKTASNVAVLTTLMVLLAAGALGMQLLRAEDTHIDLFALFAPFIVVTLPTLVIVSAAAVLFESVRWLRGGLGNVVYFFVWSFLIAVSMPGHKGAFSGIGDFLGIAAIVPSVFRSVVAAFPGVDPNTASMSIGLNFSSAAGHLATFAWPGPQWTAQVLVARFTWAAFGLGLALAASIPFDRFDTATAASRPRRERHAPKNGEPPDATPASAAHSRHVSASALPAAMRSGATLTLLRGELSLMLRKTPWAWRAVAIGLALACWLAPIGVARAYLLPFAWIWPLLLWSPMGARESMHRTEALLFSSPRPLMRQISATWLAGALVAVAIGLGVGVRLLATGDGAGALAWLGGALFIPSLALACGAWTGNGRLFEVTYLLLWYVGPMNHTPAIDFAGTQAAALGADAPARFGAITLALVAAAVLGRMRRLRG